MTRCPFPECRQACLKREEVGCPRQGMYCCTEEENKQQRCRKNGRLTQTTCREDLDNKYGDDSIREQDWRAVALYQTDVKAHVPDEEIIPKKISDHQHAAVA